ncbi:MAG: hypothetical protein QM747_20240 [Nocardioides sp.]
MSRLVAATALVASAALAGTLTVTAPAQAASISMHDAKGDDTTGRGFGDITGLHVKYGAKRLRVLITWPRSGDPGYYQDLYVDTWPKHPGPEVHIGSNGDGEGWVTTLGGGWTLIGGHQRCSGGNYSATYDYPHRRLHYSLPVRCLMPRGKAQPPKLRFALAIRSDQDVTWDWLPAKRTFGRWVDWK